MAFWIVGKVSDALALQVGNRLYRTYLLGPAESYAVLRGYALVAGASSPHAHTNSVDRVGFSALQKALDVGLPSRE